MSEALVVVLLAFLSSSGGAETLARPLDERVLTLVERGLGASPREVSAYVRFSGGETNLPRHKRDRGRFLDLGEGFYLQVWPQLWAGMAESDEPVAYSFALSRDEEGERPLRALNEPPHGDWPGNVSARHFRSEDNSGPRDPDAQRTAAREYGGLRELVYEAFEVDVRVLEFEVVEAHLDPAVRQRLRETLNVGSLPAFRRFACLVTVRETRRPRRPSP